MVFYALDFIIESNHKMSDNEFTLFVGDGAEEQLTAIVQEI